jgi:hypothetical protein
VRFTQSRCRAKYDEMPKSFHDLKDSIREWSIDPTFKGGRGVSTVMSLRTGKSDNAEKPSVRQLQNKSPTRKQIARLKNKNWSAGGIT